MVRFRGASAHERDDSPRGGVSTPEPAAPDEPGWHRPPPTRSERIADLAIALGLAVAAAIAVGLYGVAGVYDDPAPGWVTGIWVFAISLPLALRRRFPIAVGIAVAAVFATGQIAQVPDLLVSNIALFLAIYTIGAWATSRRAALIGRLVIVTGMFVWLVVSMFLQATDPDSLPGVSRVGAFSPLVAFMLAQLLVNVLYFGGAWFFGERAMASARERALLEQRTAELERERERSAAQAVALERLRIARELHDVVAHHVSVMGIQAGAARTVIDVDPSAARAALSTVEQTSRTAIDELHGLLFTLRDHEDEGGSAPGAAQLPQLVADSEAAGLPTTLTIVGIPHPLPAGVGLNLYRVAQEALTNARKHGGAGAVADVRLRFDDDAVELEIGSTGVVPGRRSPRGLGLIGMRERVAASGGTLEAGPRSRGGWLVRATVPIAGRSRA